MTITNETKISKAADNKQLIITRDFAAPVNQVWKAWTERELLDEWWAPKPWKTETQSMDFKDGGVWLYKMVGPDGAGQLCRVDYESVIPQKSFSGLDCFCDEKGNPTNDLPQMHWKCMFEETAGGTLVTVYVSFKSEADLQKIVEMGFKEGFTSAHGNLDELLIKTT